jgi:hypothetical protein
VVAMSVSICVFLSLFVSQCWRGLYSSGKIEEEREAKEIERRWSDKPELRMLQNGLRCV